MDITQLESVQRRAKRFTGKDYRCSTSVSGLLEHLHWPLLSARRTNFHLVNFYKAVNNQTAISISHLQKPSRCTRNSDETTFIPLSSLTNPREYSLFHVPSSTGTSCQVTSASNLQLTPSSNSSYHLINNNFQPWHSSDNGGTPIAVRPLINWNSGAEFNWIKSNKINKIADAG